MMAQINSSTVSDRESLLGLLLRLGDTLVVFLAGYLALYFRFSDSLIGQAYWTALILGSLLALNILALSGTYSFERVRRPLRRFGRTFLAWVTTLVSLAMLSVLAKSTDSYSRLWFFLWAGFGTAGLLGLRISASIYLARWRASGRALRRIAIVGTGQRAAALARQLRETEGDVISVSGFFRPNGPGKGLPDATPVLGSVAEIVGRWPELALDEVIIALDGDEVSYAPSIMEHARRWPLNVRYALELPSLTLPVRSVSDVGGLPMLDVWRRPLGTWDLWVKSLEDRILATLILLLILPVMLVTAIAIKLDSAGPVFFRQKRAGFNNNEFSMLKFRSMTHEPSDDHHVPQARRNDPRVTRVGRFLRRTSLDELPQLLNVLRGEMSLVGPRPHAVAHDRYYAEVIDEYLGRQRVKPGITGWAQVNGLRGETETQEKMRRRVQYDLYYIDNWSILFDMKILLLTLVVGFAHKNAY